MFTNINIYSSSPQTVFSDIDDLIYNNDDIEIDEIAKLKFEIVLREIKIKHLQNLLKKYENSHKMWTDFCNTFLK